MTCANDCNRNTDRHTNRNGQASRYRRNLADVPKSGSTTGWDRKNKKGWVTKILPLKLMDKHAIATEEKNQLLKIFTEQLEIF